MSSDFSPDQKRYLEGFSSGLAAARAARGVANHPVSPATLQGLGSRGDTSCQHALFFLRWLDATPESFLAGAAPDALSVS